MTQSLPKELEESLDAILWDLVTTLSPATTKRGIVYYDKLNTLKVLLSTAINLARENGFKDAQIGCSFNKDCKNCEANKLTLAFLGEPSLKALTEEKS